MCLKDFLRHVIMQTGCPGFLELIVNCPRWEEFPKKCLQLAPGANEITGSVGATLARDEAHERVISLNLAYQHPVHPTAENIEVMCQSAPMLCKNLLNFESKFFQQSTQKRSITAGAKSKEEMSIQSILSCLAENKAFQVLDRSKLIQPGTAEPISETIAASFLSKAETSLSIAEAIVEQQVLKRNVYNKN